jgi:hypothetical protein
MTFVKVGKRYINLNNVTDVFVGATHIEVALTTGLVEEAPYYLVLEGDDARELLVILDKIASANWFAPVEKAQPEITPVYDEVGNDLPF